MSNPKCPKCGSENITSEKRPDGDSQCMDCKHKDKLAVFYVKESDHCGVVHTVSITLKDVGGNVLQTGNMSINDINILSQLHGKSAVMIMYEELMTRDAIKRGGKCMKIWITKYALTQGIMEADVDESMDEMITVNTKDGHVTYMFPQYFSKGDWFKTKEEAVFKAEQMKQKKLKSLEKQLSKIKSMEFK